MIVQPCALMTAIARVTSYGSCWLMISSAEPADIERWRCGPADPRLACMFADFTIISLGSCAVRAAMQPDLRGGLSGSDRERPPVAGVNGPLMARRTAPRPALMAVSCSYSVLPIAAILGLWLQSLRAIMPSGDDRPR